LDQDEEIARIKRILKHNIQIHEKMLQEIVDLRVRVEALENQPKLSREDIFFDDWVAKKWSSDD
jgi:hypothetical protein